MPAQSTQLGLLVLCQAFPGTGQQTNKLLTLHLLETASRTAHRHLAFCEIKSTPKTKQTLSSLSRNVFVVKIGIVYVRAEGHARPGITGLCVRQLRWSVVERPPLAAPDLEKDHVLVSIITTRQGLSSGITRA